VEKADEFSLSQIWVTRAAGADLETVETGCRCSRSIRRLACAGRCFITSRPIITARRRLQLSCSGISCRENTVYIGGGSHIQLPGRAAVHYQTALVQGWDGGALVASLWRHLVGYYPRTLFDGNGLRNEANVHLIGTAARSSTLGTGPTAISTHRHGQRHCLNEGTGRPDVCKGPAV